MKRKVSGDSDSELLMAKDATESAKAMFMSKKSVVKKLDDNLKEALRAASVFLDNKQRGVVSSFLQAPFTGNYNAQSGEIVGVLKNMNDTSIDIFLRYSYHVRGTKNSLRLFYSRMKVSLPCQYFDMIWRLIC